MRELVNDDVVAPLGGFATRFHIPPAQHQRAAVHRLAAEFLVELVHDAGFVDHLAPRHHGIGVHDDSLEAAVPVQAETQHRQAGLRRNRDGHVVIHGQSTDAVELLLGEKQGAQFPQRIPVSGRELRKKPKPREGHDPERLGNAPTCQQPRAARMLHRPPPTAHVSGDLDARQALGVESQQVGA
jgi:hypothetical protein